MSAERKYGKGISFMSISVLRLRHCPLSSHSSQPTSVPTARLSQPSHPFGWIHRSRCSSMPCCCPWQRIRSEEIEKSNSGKRTSRKRDPFASRRLGRPVLDRVRCPVQFGPADRQQVWLPPSRAVHRVDHDLEERDWRLALIRGSARHDSVRLIVSRYGCPRPALSTGWITILKSATGDWR